MIDIKELRRLAQAATPGPWEFWHGMIATDIDNDGGVVIAKRPSPSGGKLQARVDTNFQYIAATNPAAVSELLDRLEAAEKERDDVAMQLAQSEQGKRKISEECDALQARIEAREKQEPVGKFIQHPSHGMWEQDGYSDNPDAKPLYLAPGAQTQGERK